VTVQPAIVEPLVEQPEAGRTNSSPDASWTVTTTVAVAGPALDTAGP
jgi:hypothetical protein